MAISKLYTKLCDHVKGEQYLKDALELDPKNFAAYDTYVEHLKSYGPVSTHTMLRYRSVQYRRVCWQRMNLIFGSNPIPNPNAHQGRLLRRYNYLKSTARAQSMKSLAPASIYSCKTIHAGTLERHMCLFKAHFSLSSTFSVFPEVKMLENACSKPARRLATQCFRYIH